VVNGRCQVPSRARVTVTSFSLAEGLRAPRGGEGRTDLSRRARRSLRRVEALRSPFYRFTGRAWRIICDTSRKLEVRRGVGGANLLFHGAIEHGASAQGTSDKVSTSGGGLGSIDNQGLPKRVSTDS
jgi:hypothetical protein